MRRKKNKKVFFKKKLYESYAFLKNGQDVRFYIFKLLFGFFLCRKYILNARPTFNEKTFYIKVTENTVLYCPRHKTPDPATTDSVL